MRGNSNVSSMRMWRTSTRHDPIKGSNSRSPTPLDHLVPQRKKEPRCVNARILLRQDNFDRPFLLFLPTVDHLQGSLLFVLLLAKIDATTPPYGWSPPPGPSVVDGWRRDERTRDRPQSKLECARLVCQAYHRHPGSTTSRPPRPRLAHSRCPQGR